VKLATITPPASEPITYAEVKVQCRLDSDTEQNWLTSNIIPAARATAEHETGRSLITQTIAATIYRDDLRPHAAFIASTIRLPRGPVQSIVSITDAQGSTLAADKYELRRFGLEDSLVLKTSPAFPLTVTYLAGWGATAAAIPPDIKQAMLAHCAWMWENRSADVSPKALDAIYSRYRGFAG
jgi:uncharacterized phiE125 gp8 family phage protein